MISLKRSMEDFDFRLMFETAIGCYRSTVESLEQNTIRLEYDGFVQYRKKLQELQGRLHPQALRPENLRTHAEELQLQLAQYRTGLESLFQETGDDLKKVVAVLAGATESLSHREKSHSTQLARLSGSLEAISEIDNLPQLRGKLSTHVVELRACLEQITRENETAVQCLQRELAAFRQKLEAVQIEASMDSLTGIANRRTAGREIALRMREQRTFGILLLDLNKFKQINDTHGHGAGDCVLRIVAQRLSGQVRKDDLVCRWGGDEFLIIRDGSGEELSALGKEFAGRIAGNISVDVAGRTLEIAIGAEVGWAEYRPGETAEELLDKADSSLYRSKVPRTPAAVETKTSSGTIRPFTKTKREVDLCTGLAGMKDLEAEIARLGPELESWCIACFAIRNPAALDSHYGYAATEQVLPFVRDEIRGSVFGELLFRGRGASILTLCKAPGPNPGLSQDMEREMRRIGAIGFEKALMQKRRQSVRPIVVVGSLIPLDPKRGTAGAIQDLNRHTTLQNADDKLATSFGEDPIAMQARTCR